MKTFLLILMVSLALFACNNSNNPTVLPSTVATPVIRPESGSYSTAQEISITCSTSDAEVRYTLDGTEPIVTSELYTGPFQLAASATVKAKGFKDNWLSSAVSSKTYSFQVANLFIIPMGGSYTAPLSVQIVAVTPGTPIFYTTDGMEPTAQSAVYTSPFIIGRNTNLKAKGIIAGWTDSPTVSVNFTFQTTQPVFSVTPGIYPSPFTVSLSSPTADSEIRYTTDGTIPDETSNLFINPLNINVNTQIKARTFKDGWNPGNVISGNFNLQAATPTFSPLQGSFYTPQSVTISCTTPQTIIYYTTNGSNPTTSSSVYTVPIQVGVNTAIKAMAVKADWVNSSVATGNYNFNIYAPQFSLPGGQYSGTIVVSITCQTPGAQIRYTTDTYTPTQSSPLYTGPLQVSSNTMLIAKAFKQGYIDSPSNSASYMFNNNVATPEFSPPPGDYNVPTLITIYCGTPNAVIRYTMDGSEPTTLSDVYNSPMLLNSDTTIKARAFHTNWNPSPVVTGVYQVNVPMVMVQIPAGVYTMGDTHGTGFSDAIPTHLVSLSAYEISNFEIRQQEWLGVMGYNPSAYIGNLHRPVESVSMFACLVYCNKKSIQEGLTPVYSVNGTTNPDYWGPVPTTWDIPSYDMWSLATCNWSANGYRLPTEAEWEYAARGASVNPDYLYSGGDNIGILGWYGTNGSLETHPVGQKLANALGLYDMSGNVREWCWDWYDEDYYASSPSNNPHGPEEPSTHYRSIRGGSFMDVSTLCMNCARGQKEAYSSQMYIGFRIVRANN